LFARSAYTLAKYACRKTSQSTPSTRSLIIDNGKWAELDEEIIPSLVGLSLAPFTDTVANGTEHLAPTVLGDQKEGRRRPLSTIVAFLRCLPCRVSAMLTLPAEATLALLTLSAAPVFPD
jgi:hypothetical protein